MTMDSEVSPPMIYMKIIVAYVSAGAGHRKAAEALYHFFKKESKSADIKLVDVLEKTNFIFRNSYIYGYRFLINHAMWLWGVLFWLTSSRRLNFVIKPLCFIFNRFNTRKFSEFLIRAQPDTIISTHFLPSEIATHLKREYKINSNIVTIITDFGIHPFWILPGTDIYIVASSFSKVQLLAQGGKASFIYELGIPVNTEFTKQYDKNAICKKLGLAQNKLTAMITTGSFGIGPIEKIVKLINNDVQVIVVCANNKRLYKRLKQKSYPNVAVFGFIDNIPELMAAADIVIAKPGGLTTSEILNMESAPIFISPIRGQETANIQAMAQFGIGRFAKHAEDIKAIILDYMKHPEELTKIKKRIREIKKPNAIRDIYNVVC